MRFYDWKIIAAGCPRRRGNADQGISVGRPAAVVVFRVTERKDSDPSLLPLNDKFLLGFDADRRRVPPSVLNHKELWN